MKRQTPCNWVLIWGWTVENTRTAAVFSIVEREGVWWLRGALPCPHGVCPDNVHEAELWLACDLQVAMERAYDRLARMLTAWQAEVGSELDLPSGMNIQPVGGGKGISAQRENIPFYGGVNSGEKKIHS